MSAALKRFYAHVAKQPCLRCGNYGVQVCHIKMMPSAKANDLMPRRVGASQFAAVPLCDECHRLQHEVGETAFYELLGKEKAWVFGYCARLIAESMA
jgi:hypothetical protein